MTRRDGLQPRNIQRFTAWAVLGLALVIIVATPVFQTIPWVATQYDQKRIAELVLVLLSLVIFAVNPGSAVTLPRTARLGFVSLGVLGAASSILSGSPRHATMELALLAGLVFLALVVAGAFRAQAQAAIRLTWWALALGTTLIAVKFLAGCAGALIQARPLSPLEIVPGFSNYRFLNQVQTWTIPLLALGAFAQPPPSRIALGVGHTALACSWLMLLATGGRGSAVGLLFAVSLGALIFRRSAWPFVRFQFIGLVCGILIYLLIFQLAPWLRGIDESLVPELGRSTDSGRIALWIWAKDMILENPVLGVGPHHFAWFPNAHSLAHPHNAALQIASEWGLPALLIAAGLGAWGLGKWTAAALSTEADASMSSVRIALWMSLVAGLTHSMFSGILVTPLSQLLLALVCGALLGTYPDPGAISSDSSTGSTSASRVAALLVVGALLISATPDLPSRLAGGKLSTQGMEVAGPRIWQLGGIPISRIGAGVAASTMD